MTQDLYSHATATAVELLEGIAARETSRLEDMLAGTVGLAIQRDQRTLANRLRSADYVARLAEVVIRMPHDQERAAYQRALRHAMRATWWRRSSGGIALTLCGFLAGLLVRCSHG